MPDINLPRRKSVRCIFTRLQGLGLEGNVEYCETATISDLLFRAVEGSLSPEMIWLSIRHLI